MNTTTTTAASIALAAPRPRPAVAMAPATGGRRVPVKLVALLAAVAVAGALGWLFKPWRGTGPELGPAQFYAVAPIDIEIKVAKDGELQPISYTDVKSEVEGTTQIIELVPEGTTVNKGDVLVQLDSANLVTRKEQLELDIRKAESVVTIAEEMRAIQENQNNTNLEAAQVNLELAELDLKQYVEGTYPQQLQNARTTLSMAEITLRNREEELSQTNGLFARGFVTAADVKKAELDVTVARNELQKARTALTVLEKYTHPMEMARLKSLVMQAEQRRNRVQRINRSEMAQRTADLEEKRESLAMLQRRLEKLQQQLEACTIRAPEDGLVIYASSIDRNLREPIQEGTTVRLSQWLIRLPNVKAMKAVLKIQEAQKPKLDETKGQRAMVKILGVPEPIGATLTKVSVLPDNGARWWNPDLREYPVELTLDRTPPGLKPGVRVENAEIFISRHEQVLAVPLAALYTVGRDAYVFVKEGDGVKERKVKIGVASETHVEVTSGLSKGEEVLLLAAGQGRMLLEKAGVKIAEPPAQRPPERQRDRDPRAADARRAPGDDKASEAERNASAAPAAPATPEKPSPAVKVSSLKE